MALTAHIRRPPVLVVRDERPMSAHRSPLTAVSGQTVVMAQYPELSEGRDGAMLAVHVQPGAGRTEVVGRHGDALKIRVAAPPTGNRANDAVVELVAREFAIKEADVVVTSGASNQEKRLQLTGVDVRAAERVVDRLLASAGPGGTRR